MTRATTEAIARIIDPLVFDLTDALNNADGEPEKLRADATALRDARLARVMAKAEAIEALSTPPMGEVEFSGVAGELKPGAEPWEAPPAMIAPAMRDLSARLKVNDALAQPGSEGEAIEHLRRCVLLVPPPGAIEAAERFLASTPAIRDPQPATGDE